MEAESEKYVCKEVCHDRGMPSSYTLATMRYWSPGVISVVAADGRLKQQYGQSQLSDVGQRTNPTGLAVNSKDYILVADKENSRIVLI